MNNIKPRDNKTPSCSVFLDRVVRWYTEHRLRPVGTGLELNEMSGPRDVSEAEQIEAAKKIPIRKVPGLNGVPDLAIKAAALNVLTFFQGNSTHL